jgi:hypothetical protein
MKPNILKSNLFSPGTKFIATDDVKDTTLPPHSVGFLSFFKNPDRDYQNVVYALAIVIRRGKAGQERIEQKEISFPIFTDKKMLEHEDYLPLGRKFYIHIEEESFNEKTLMNIAPLEFLGWCLAYTRYLKYITKNFVYPTKRANWTEEMVSRSLMDADKILSNFTDSPAGALRLYSSGNFRHDFIVAARKLESKLTKCICSYKKSTVASILNSSYFIEYTNDNYYEVMDKRLAKNTVSFYKNKYKKISDLVEKNKALKKKGEA